MVIGCEYNSHISSLFYIDLTLPRTKAITRLRLNYPDYEACRSLALGAIKANSPYNLPGLERTVYCYDIHRRLRIATSDPIPNSNSVAGSGTRN